MKLEEEMYVRIKNEAGWCCIGKIENINDYRGPSMKYCIDIRSNDFVFIPEDMIAKASHNIIDLIEIGDYVNGCLVVNKYEACDYAEQCIKLKGNANYFYDIHIKSIVTKEQFESMSYKAQ